MNESTTVLEVMPNSDFASRGTTERSSPTMPPTKALTSTSKLNCCQFSRSPSRIGAGASGLGDRTAVRPSFQLSGIGSGKLTGFVQAHDFTVIRRGWRQASEQCVRECLLAACQQSDPIPELSDRGNERLTVEF